MADMTRAYREKTGKKLTTMDKKIINATYNYLLALRQSDNAKKHQVPYDKLYKLCDEANVDISSAISASRKVLKYDIAAMMSLGKI